VLQESLKVALVDELGSFTGPIAGREPLMKTYMFNPKHREQALRIIGEVCDDNGFRRGMVRDGSVWIRSG